MEYDIMNCPECRSISVEVFDTSDYWDGIESGSYTEHCYCEECGCEFDRVEEYTRYTEVTKCGKENEDGT